MYTIEGIPDASKDVPRACFSKDETKSTGIINIRKLVNILYVEVSVRSVQPPDSEKSLFLWRTRWCTSANVIMYFVRACSAEIPRELLWSIHKFLCMIRSIKYHLVEQTREAQRVSRLHGKSRHESGNCRVVPRHPESTEAHGKEKLWIGVSPLSSCRDEREKLSAAPLHSQDRRHIAPKRDRRAKLEIRSTLMQFSALSSSLRAFLRVNRPI